MGLSRTTAAAAAGLLVLLGVARTGGVAQVGGYLAEADLSRFEAIGTAGVSGKDASPEDVYYGAKLLAALGKKPGGVGVCATAQALVNGRADDAASVGFGLAALKEGGCASELAAARGNAEVVSTLKRAWQSDTFQGKRLALLGDLVLGGGKALESEAAAKQLNKHRNEDGLVVELLEGGGGAASTEGTFALLETLAQAKVASKGIRKTLEKALLLLPGGAADAGADDASLLPALDQALRALGAEAGPAALALGDGQVAVLARKLLRMKAATSPKAAYKAVAGLQLLASLPNAPLGVAVATPVVAPGEPFRVEVRTLLGQAPPASALAAGGVVVESLQVPGKGHDLDAFRDQALKRRQDGAFEGETAGLAPGLYELVLAVGGAGGIKRSLIVTGAGAVQGVEVEVAGKVHKLGRGQTLPAGVRAVALEGDVVRAAFTLDSPAPAQQAFLRFRQRGAEGVETLYAAKRQERAGGQGWEYGASVALVDEMAAFAHASGEYELSLLVGDVSLAKPVEVALGGLTLGFPARAKEQFPLYARPLLWDSDNALAPLPEIHHQFRQPERRPNPVVPAVFTALVLAALVFFALYLPRIGANLEAFPTGADSAWAAAWMACLTAIVLLFAAYWVKLTAATTLRYLLGLALVTLFVGSQASRRKSAAPK